MENFYFCLKIELNSGTFKKVLNMIAQVRNAFRIKVFDWYESLPTLGIKIVVWNEIQLISSV